MNEPMVAGDKEYKARKEALKRRLVGLGSDNPVVKEAIKSNTLVDNSAKMAEWRVVDELYYAARKRCMDSGESVKSSVANLIKALQKI
jgi:hypothetical protein